VSPLAVAALVVLAPAVAALFLGVIALLVVLLSREDIP
jgi:hypothetical protein